mmetsp:Transcript_27567/g.41951  ORF Transcript_27567/g.41951 Transcript_27567/m.41951 type:complete len:1171 (+) Transcript_27567:85-3597(+)
MTNPSNNLRTGKKRTEAFEGEVALCDDNTSVRQQRGAAAEIENVGYTTGEAYLNQKVKMLCTESKDNARDRKMKKSKKKKSKTKKRSSKEESQIDDVALGNDKCPNEDSENDQINISLQPQHYVENDVEKKEKSESLKRTESNKISDVHHKEGFAKHQYVTESSSKISKLRMRKESIEKSRESFRSHISSLELRSKEGISFSSQNSSTTAASTDPMASIGECSNSMGTHDALDELDETSDRKTTIVTHVPGIKRSSLFTAENSMEYQRKSFDVCSGSATCSQDMTVLPANISDRSSYFCESNLPYFGRKEENSQPVKIREMSSPTNRPSDQQKYISKNAQQPTKHADNSLFADHSLSFLSPKSIKNCSSSPLCDKIRVEEGAESYGTSGRVSLIKEKGLENITKTPVVKPSAERYDVDISIQKQKIAVGSVAESYDGTTRIERREMLTNGKTRLPLKSDSAENAADLLIRDSLICNPPGAYAIGGPIVLEETEIEEQRFTSSEGFAARNSSVPDSRVEEHLLIEAKLVTEFPKQDEMQNHCSCQQGDRNIGNENAQRDTLPVVTDSIVIVHAKKVTPYCSKRRAIVLCVVIVGASIIGILTFIICKSQNKQSEAIPPVIPMIQRIKQNGFLRCSVIEAKIANDYAKLKGVENFKESVVCRAIAAALFGGDGSKVELVETPLKTRFQDLSTGRVDVGLNSLVHTMDRTLHIDNENLQSGLVFSSPYFYHSTSFGGDPKFVSCAEEGFKIMDEECNDLKVCVLSATRIPAMLDPLIPQTNLIGCTDWNDLFDSFVEGRCNVVLAPEIRILLMRVKNSDYSRNITNITVSKTVFHPEPLGIVTRNDDPEWSDFCQWVVQALMTISDNSKFKQTDVFGKEFSSMFQDIQSEIGNWNDLFEGFVNEDITPNAGLNSVNNGTTGLIRSLPLGSTDIVGPDPVIGGTIRDIIERGYIRCVLRIDRRGFAERISFNQTIKKYKGMDVDYCRAVAASIFGSGAEEATIEWKEVTNSTHAFGLLNEGAVDLVAGIMVNLERDVRESSTGVGFSFTNPYFFNNSGLDNTAEESLGGNDLNLCLVTRQDDVQWSNYVYWIVECTFFAEESNISSSIANDMPQVSLFGEGLERMFRDAILAVGNYGDIYEENVESIIPRARRNLLNPNSKPGPQLYALPGVLA